MTSWLDDLTSRSPMKAKIGWTGELEFNGATEDDRSGRVVKFRVVRRPEEMGQAHPFSRFIRRRGKTTGTIFETAITSVASGAVVYSAPVMLLNWSDGPGGATVTLLVESDEPQHPFLGYSRASKQVAGSRFMAVFLEKEDDATLHEQAQTELAARNAATGNQQKLSNVAALFCKNALFHDFLREQVSDTLAWNEKTSAQWLKDTLRINSRSELDSGAADMQPVIANFHRIRKQWLAWQEERGFETDPRYM